MKDVGVLRKQDNFVGVLRKQEGGINPQYQIGDSPYYFTPNTGGSGKGQQMPLRRDPERGIESRGFEQMMADRGRAQLAQAELANIQSRRETLDTMGALDDKKFADAQAAQRQEQINKPILEARIDAKQPRTYQEKYGLEASQRAQRGQEATAYRRGGLGGTVGRALGAGAAGAYSGLQALLALNRAGASGQDAISALGGAGLQGAASYGTVAPKAQNIGGQVGSRVAVRGGQVMDEGRDLGQSFRERFREGMRPAEPTVAENLVGVEPRFTIPSKSNYNINPEDVTRARATNPDAFPRHDAQGRPREVFTPLVNNTGGRGGDIEQAVARGAMNQQSGRAGPFNPRNESAGAFDYALNRELPVGVRATTTQTNPTTFDTQIAPAAPAPAAPAAPAPPPPGQGTLTALMEQGEKEQKEAAKKEQERAEERKESALDELARQAQQGSVQGGF